MKFNIRAKLTGRVFAFGAVFLMSLAPIVVKFGLRQALDPIPLLTVRFWLAAITLVIVVWIFDRSALRVPRGKWLPLVVVALIFGLSFICYYVALSYIDASIAHMLVAVSPAVVLLLLFFAGQKIGAKSVLRMGLVLAGLVLLVGPSGSLNLVGVAFGIAQTLFYGAFLFFVERWLPDVPSNTITVYVDLVVAIQLSAVYAFLYREWQPMTTTGWGIIIFTGLFTTALAHFLYVSSVKAIGSGETALINPFETVFTVTWAAIFLGERLTAIQWLGGGLILLSAFLISRRLAAPLPVQKRPSTN
ncbi:MAG: DMT family transporter [Anaerolineales bacterium]